MSFLNEDQAEGIREESHDEQRARGLKTCEKCGASLERPKCGKCGKADATLVDGMYLCNTCHLEMTHLIEKWYDSNTVSNAGIIPKIFYENIVWCKAHEDRHITIGRLENILVFLLQEITEQVKKNADLYSSDSVPAGKHDAIFLEALFGKTEQNSEAQS